MSNRYYTEAEIICLVTQFDNRSILKDNWTHEVHLTVALWYIKKHGLFEGICRLKSGIICLNVAHQTENNGHTGYHETLTVFWCRIIDAYVQHNKDQSLEELVNDFLHSDSSSKNLPFLYYDREKLMSSGLRAVYEHSDKQL